MSNNFDGLVSERRNNFDFVRFLLSCLVIYAHCYGLLRPKQTELLTYLTHSRIDSGGLAVGCFFMLSGFLISLSWSRSWSIKDFIARRILRIYPGWIVSLTVCFLVVAPLSGMPIGTYHDAKSLWFFGPLILHWQSPLPNVFSSNPYPGNINGSLWTLPFEVICYFYLALLGCLGLLRHRTGVLALFVLVLIGSAWSAYSGRPHYRTLPYFGSLNQLIGLMSYFMVGMTFFCYRKEIPKSRPICALSFLILVISARKNIGFNLILPVLGAYLLFYLSHSQSLKFYNFSRFGDFSYGMYLYSFPVQQLLIHFFPGRLSPATLLLSAFPIALCCAILSWRWIEKPALALKNHRYLSGEKFLLPLSP